MELSYKILTLRTLYLKKIYQNSKQGLYIYNYSVTIILYMI